MSKWCKKQAKELAWPRFRTSQPLELEDSCKQEHNKNCWGRSHRHAPSFLVYETATVNAAILQRSNVNDYHFRIRISNCILLFRPKILLRAVVISSNETFLAFCFSGVGPLNNSAENKEKEYPKSTGSFSHLQTIPPSYAQPQKSRGHWLLCTQFHGCYKQTVVPIPSVKWAIATAAWVTSETCTSQVTATLSYHVSFVKGSHLFTWV